MRFKFLRRSAPFVAAVAAAALYLPACGGGGGGGDNGPSIPGNMNDPIVVLSGGSIASTIPPTSPNSARLSRTIDEANNGNGASPPPSLEPIVTAATGNHWFRLEFPFNIDRTSLLDSSVQNAPFSYLSGNITVTDVNGNHIPGLAMVDGIDAFGVDHKTNAGFPHDLVGSGNQAVDRNVGPGVFLYVADVDRNLSTIAAFGYKLNGTTRFETQDSLDPTNAVAPDSVRITLSSVNGLKLSGVWAIHIGRTVDVRPPFVRSVISEIKDPTLSLPNPTDSHATYLFAHSAAPRSSFVVEFSEPMVPKSVGRTVLLPDGRAYDGNMPLSPFIPPLPSIALTVTTTVGKIYVPFDCVPVGSNNLATYRLTPLVDLPPNLKLSDPASPLDNPLNILIRAVTTNTDPNTLASSAAMDLAGNRYDGQDADNDQVPDHVDRSEPFSTGPGAGFVNIPVSPEVVYWLPSQGDGVGAIDLDGMGITTNTPGANSNQPNRAPIITRNWFNPNSGCEVNPGGLNLASGIAYIAYPDNRAGTPTDACTNLPMTMFGHNRYWYPVGTGSYPYGPAANAARSQDWFVPADPGNPGTPMPGVNEGSSGFETLCRDSNGDAILTGRQFGRVGVLNDMILGDFLDIVYYDSQSAHTDGIIHVTIFNSPRPHTPTGRGNTIADPPTPNPPPLKYWLGLPTIGVVIDQANPTAKSLLIEGDEVFSGTKGFRLGFQQLQPSTVNANAHDETIFPHVGVGPWAQSSTVVSTFSARQQIGNFLYATDATTHEVHAINSNTMRVIESLSLPDPYGLAISPDMTKLYVTNFGNDTMSVISSDPYSPTFHQEIARIATGAGPRSVAVECDNEDIMVCNYMGNTVSIIDTKSLSLRKTLDALVNKPYDVETTPRQIEPTSPNPRAPNTIGFGCGIYFAYISNQGGNDVLVYESGPDGPQGIGINNILGALPTNTDQQQIIEPRGLCASPFPNPAGVYAGGCFVVHRDVDGKGRVSQIQFTQQAIFGPLPIAAPPGLRIPPGFLNRQFEVTATWGDSDSNRLSGVLPSDLTLADLTTTGYHSRPSAAPNLACTSTPPQVAKTGAINSKHPMRLAVPACYAAVVPDRLYVAYEDTDTIDVLSPQEAGIVVNRIPGGGVLGVKKLMSYWRQ